MGNACTGCFDKTKNQNDADALKEKFVDNKGVRNGSKNINIVTETTTDGPEEPDTYRGPKKDIKFD